MYSEKVPYVCVSSRLAVPEYCFCLSANFFYFLIYGETKMSGLKLAGAPPASKTLSLGSLSPLAATFAALLVQSARLSALLYCDRRDFTNCHFL